MAERFLDEQSGVVLEDSHGRLQELLEAAPQFERIASGFGFTEGPVWRGDHLLFSDIPNDRICRWRELPEGPELTTFRAGNGSSNGLTLDRDGHLMAATHGARAVLWFDADDKPHRIVTEFEGRCLNSPNDLAMRRAGDLYFTDPPYGIDALGPETREQPVNGVYRLAPDGSVHLVTDRFKRPNGLAFSPDDTVLYVGDSGGPRDIWALDVALDGSIANARQFVDMDDHLAANNPDGMKCDMDGRLWSTGPGGIWVIEPDGTVLGVITTPARPANIAWGGKDWSTLFVTARDSVYRLQTKVHGRPVP